VKPIRVGPEERRQLQERLAAFDSHNKYPLGDDFFQLDHGSEYYAFFDRLGEVHAYVVLDGEVIAGGGIAILRRVPFRQGEPPRKAWYLCDAKVHPDRRGQRIGLRSVTRLFLSYYLRCPRAYGISMNPGDGSPNPVVRHAQRFKFAPMKPTGTLHLFSLDEEAMRRLEPVVVRHRGPVSYLSLEGKKDLILESTGTRMPLLHVQFGPCAEKGYARPLPGHTHMLCALADDPLARELEGEGIRPSATATIISHRMSKSDWRFVLTSDI
jgi:GNAT superfamily N-acetyltransferase